ncbi:hypothetical protein CYMTET_33518, partial [Cymbomonas tetramitiformis]
MDALSDALTCIPETTKPDGTEPSSILLVEDCRPSQLITLGGLKRLNAKVQVANNGMEAVNLVQEGSIFNIIFMDINMPVMDGITATKKICAICKLNGWAAPAIIGVTANEDDAEDCGAQRTIEEGMAAGMIDVLYKPLRKDTLMQILSQHRTKSFLPNNSESENLSEDFEQVPEDTGDFHGPKILLVDTNLMRSRAMQIMLYNHGYEVTVVSKLPSLLSQCVLAALIFPPLSQDPKNFINCEMLPHQFFGVFVSHGEEKPLTKDVHPSIAFVMEAEQKMTDLIEQLEFASGKVVSHYTMKSPLWSHISDTILKLKEGNCERSIELVHMDNSLESAGLGYNPAITEVCLGNSNSNALHDQDSSAIKIQVFHTMKMPTVKEAAELCKAKGMALSPLALCVPKFAHKVEKHVLIVDDSRIALQTVSMYLSQMGFTVTSAPGGREGCDILQQEAPRLLPNPSLDLVHALHAPPLRDAANHPPRLLSSTIRASPL